MRTIFKLLPAALCCLILVDPCFGQSQEQTADEKVLAGHSYHGEAFNEGPRQQAYLMGGLGQADFPVTTCSERAQKFFNQGIDQLHGFWYFEAERSFRQVVVLDADCAMAYWGLAMANVNNRERASDFIQQALDKAESDEIAIADREMLWINSLAKFYDEDTKDKKQRASNLIDGLEKIILEYPEDVEAKAFLACQVWMNQQNGIDISSHVSINAILDEVFQVNPMHPAHHYRIHLWDYKAPEQALRSSARGGPSLPAIAHMWHMPGHIYSRLKRYEDAVWQQEASARVDHRHMMHDRVLPDQIHNFAHNNEWCIRNLNHIGRVRDAVDLATNMISMPRHPKYNTLDDRGSAWYGRQRLMLTLSRYELWEELIELCHTSVLEPTDDTTEQIKRLRYLGRACYRSGQIEKGDATLVELDQKLVSLEQKRDEKAAEALERVKKRIEKLQAAATQLESWIGDERFPGFMDNLRKQIRRQARAEKERARSKARQKFTGDMNVARNATSELKGHQAIAAGELQRGHELLKKAGQVDALYRAWVRLQFDDREDVLQAAREYVDDHENEVQPLAMLAWLLMEANEPDEAREAFEQLRQISGSIDLQSPVFTRLENYSQQLGIDGDWRVPAEPAADLGQRPDINSLGPFRWSPAAAPDWELPDARQQMVSSKQFQDQPVVVIFYLGHGCLHCAEQLQEFVPMAKQFREAGIEMIAISTDDQEGLRKSIENYGESEMPIRLMADPEQSVFRQYSAYDEFEEQPLHGTFLIDGRGKIRWQDISYEPFMEADFLLEEAQRLLAIEQ